MPPPGPEPSARLRALQVARAAIESYVLGGRPFDPALSLILDAIYDAEKEPTMTPDLDRALIPSAFDFATCVQCKQPVAVPLSLLLAAPKTAAGEPRAFAIHTGDCERAFAAAIDHGGDGDTEAVDRDEAE